jgi:hypothetical protein
MAAAMAHHHQVAVFMTMLAGSFALLAILPKPVMAEYSCSQATVVPEEATDFFNYLKAACNALLERADPNKSNLMHVEMVDSKTNQTLYVWATCGSKEDANYCKVYIYVHVVIHTKPSCDHHAGAVVGGLIFGLIFFHFLWEIDLCKVY